MRASCMILVDRGRVFGCATVICIAPCAILMASGALMLMANPAMAQTGGAKTRQVGGAPSLLGGGQIGPLAALLPKLATAPAPKWVQPGLRLTFYGASASVAGYGKQWTIDPEGNFVSADGQHWSATDKLGASGQGLTHFDIVAVNPDKVAVSTSTYLIIPGSAPQSTTSGIFFGAPGAPGDIWVNPDVLRQLSNRNSNGLRVSRLPYKLPSGSKPAVWVHTTTANGHTLYVYEEATGVLLHYSASTGGQASPVIGHDEASNTANTTLVTTTIVAQRVISMPWNHDPPSAQAASLRSLQYSGTVTTFIPGSPAIGIPTSLTLSRTASGSGWQKFTGQSTMGGNGIPPSSSETEILAGPYALGVWISPEGLGRLRPGQQLDRDPATGIVATVNRPGRTPNGTEMVVITLQNAIEQNDLGYDKSNGLLVYINRVQRVSPATNQTQLYLRSAR